MTDGNSMMCSPSNRLAQSHGYTRGRHSRFPCVIVRLLAIGILVCGCAPSQKCAVKKMRAGQRLATLVYHLKRDGDSDKAPGCPPWAQEYPEVLRGEYAIKGNAISFAKGGVVYARDAFLESPPGVLSAHDVVVVASPEYVGCGSEFVVVYGDAHYKIVSPGDAEFDEARRLANEWSAGKAD